MVSLVFHIALPCPMAPDLRAVALILLPASAGVAGSPQRVKLLNFSTDYHITPFSWESLD